MSRPITPIVDVFAAADYAHALLLVTQNARLRAALAQARATIAAQDQRIDLLQRANERHESLKFKVRDGVTA